MLNVGCWMKEENVIVDKTYAFALEVMRLARLLREQKEYELASQLWRAGTSIGANVEEAQAGESRADFRSKMAIAAKEARETCDWLKLARDGKIRPEDLITPLTDEIESIKRILPPSLRAQVELILDVEF